MPFIRKNNFQLTISILLTKYKQNNLSIAKQHSGSTYASPTVRGRVGKVVRSLDFLCTILLRRHTMPEDPVVSERRLNTRRHSLRLLPHGSVVAPQSCRQGAAGSKQPCVRLVITVSIHSVGIFVAYEEISPRFVAPLQRAQTYCLTPLPTDSRQACRQQLSHGPPYAQASLEI